MCNKHFQLTFGKDTHREVKDLGSEREGLPLDLLCFLVGVSADTVISMLSGSPPSSSIAFTREPMTIQMIMGISFFETMISDHTVLCMNYI